MVVNDRGCCGVRGLQSLSTASPLHKLPFVRLAANGGFEPFADIRPGRSEFIGSAGAASGRLRC